MAIKSPVTLSRLKKLSARIPDVTEFRNREEEESALSKVGKTAAVVGGLGAAAYGATAVKRGIDWQKKVLGRTPTSASDVVGAFKTGHRMNKATVGGAVRGAQASSSAFVQGAKEQAAAKVAPAVDAIKGKINPAMSSARNVAGNAVAAASNSNAMSALRKLKLRVRSGGALAVR